MKTKTFFITIFFLIYSITMFSQGYTVIEKQYVLDNPFTDIIVDGPFRINYTSGNNAVATVICTPEYIAKVKLENILQSDGTSKLKLTSTGIKNPKTLIVNIENLGLKYVELSGSAIFHTQNPLYVDKMFVRTAGTSSAYITGVFDSIEIRSGSTSTAVIAGESNEVFIYANNLGEVDVSQLKYKTAHIEAFSVAHVNIGQEGENSINSYDMSTVNAVKGTSVSYTPPDNNPQTSSVDDGEEKMVITAIESSDSTFVNLSGSGLQIRLGSRGDNIFIGPYEIVINSKERFRTPRIFKRKKEKFDGHWGGIELAINGYNTASFNMDFPTEYKYMDLRFPKSTSFYLNLFEYNISLAKNQKWGMISGLGFEWHNYRFLRDVWLIGDSSTLRGYYIEGADVKKSKLMTCYLTIPLILEFQTNNRNRFNSFHVGAGVVGGLRIGTHSKVKFGDWGSAYTLIDPMTGAPVANFDITSGDKIVKNQDDFFVNPVKLDATVRVGWGRINLFATYSIFNMFQKNRGPELYPWSAGITLLGW